MTVAILLQISDKSFWGDLPTWGLLLVGIVGAGIAVYTLFDIREQTGALINSERAWIMVDVDRVPGVGGIMDGHGTEMGVGPVATESTGFRDTHRLQKRWQDASVDNPKASWPRHP